MNKHLIWGIVSVIGCALVHFTLGYFYTVGNITPYLQEFLGITSSQAIWINSVMLSCQAISMPIGGFLYKKIGFRYVTIIAMVLSSGGVLLSRLTVNVSYGPFLVTYAIMFGLGIGLPYSVLFAVASAWFPAHRAVIVGIISAGFGMGALIFTPIQSALINPENLQNFNDPSIRKRIPRAFLIIGGILLGVQIIGLAIIRENKTEKMADDAESSKSVSFIGEPPSIVKQQNTEPNSMVETELSTTDQEISEDNQEVPEPVVNPRNYTLNEALKTIDFYILLAIAFLDAIPINLLSSTYKNYGKENYNNDSYLTAIATVTSVFNCGGRIIWGAIVDKFSFKCPMGWFLLQWTILFATFPFIGYAGTDVFKVLYPIWVFPLYFTLAGHFSILPSATLRIFGPLNMSTIYGLIFLAIAPSSLLLSAILSQFNIKGKWVEVYLASAAVSAVAFVLSTFLRDRNGHCTTFSNTCANVCNVWRPDFSDEEEEGETIVEEATSE